MKAITSACLALLAAWTLAVVPDAHADAVTDANARAAEVASKLPGTPPAVRAMAIVQVSVFEAVNAISGRYPPLRVKIAAAPGASVEAAVAAATRTALAKLVPAQQVAIESHYQAAMRPLPDGPAKHPEYPCAHCIVSASLGAVLQADLGTGPVPPLSSTSATAGGATRTWKSVDDFVQEVAVARIYDGVHYRNSTVVGTEMGK